MQTRPQLVLIATAASLLMLSSCATNREVPFRVHPGAPPTGKMAKFDYSRYPRIADKLSEFCYRTVQRAVPWTRKHAFRGNWAGSGWGAGLPIDAMDEVFRMHDIVYAECRSSRTLRWADAACIESLHKLDTETLPGEAIE